MATLASVKIKVAIDWMKKRGSSVNKIETDNQKGFGGQKQIGEKKLKEISGSNSGSLLFNRKKMRLTSKLKSALVKLNRQKAQFKRNLIQKNRQEKLQKFRINYIPLCSDEDWEAMAEFYSKKEKK